MKAELAILLEILEEQKAIQGVLVALSERKTKAIASGKTDALSDIVEEEKGLLAQIKAVEKKQGRCVDKLAALLNIPSAEVRMSLIIEAAQGEQKDMLVKLRGELSELVEKQIQSNEINMKLLQMNMDYVQFLINTTSRQQAAPVYGTGGTLDKPAEAAKRLLDRKV